MCPRTYWASVHVLYLTELCPRLGDQEGFPLVAKETLKLDWCKDSNICWFTGMPVERHAHQGICHPQITITEADHAF